MQFLFVCFVIVSLVQLQAEVISVSDDDDFAKVVEVSRASAVCLNSIKSSTPHHQLTCSCMTREVIHLNCLTLLGETAVNKYDGIDSSQASKCRNHRFNCRQSSNIKQCCRALLCYKGIRC